LPRIKEVYGAHANRETFIIDYREHLKTILLVIYKITNHFSGVMYGLLELMRKSYKQMLDYLHHQLTTCLGSN